jgi:hypothetical protein
MITEVVNPLTEAFFYVAYLRWSDFLNEFAKFNFVFLSFHKVKPSEFSNIFTWCSES